MSTPRAQSGINTPIPCRHCGYDLSGLDGSTCPECGAAFVKGEETSQLRSVVQNTQGGRCKVCGSTVAPGVAKCPTCGCRAVRH